MATASMNKLNGRKRRAIRVRKKVKGTEVRPRLSIFRSAKHIYGQVIDDVSGRTLASASSLKVAGDELKKVDVAYEVGKALGAKCVEANITIVCFDRNGFRFHGRVKRLADGAREAGLQF
jgi:large subunit ribosomal protein L18